MENFIVSNWHISFLIYGLLVEMVHVLNKWNKRADASLFSTYVEIAGHLFYIGFPIYFGYIFGWLQGLAMYAAGFIIMLAASLFMGFTLKALIRDGSLRAFIQAMIALFSLPVLMFTLLASV